ncbi:hypothetical protein MHYP_G00330620 [Metynnis hypsauchen]
MWPFLLCEGRDTKVCSAGGASSTGVGKDQCMSPPPYTWACLSTAARRRPLPDTLPRAGRRTRRDSHRGRPFRQQSCIPSYFSPGSASTRSPRWIWPRVQEFNYGTDEQPEDHLSRVSWSGVSFPTGGLPVRDLNGVCVFVFGRLGSARLGFRAVWSVGGSSLHAPCSVPAWRLALLSLLKHALQTQPRCFGAAGRAASCWIGAGRKLLALFTFLAVQLRGCELKSLLGRAREPVRNAGLPG